MKTPGPETLELYAQAREDIVLDVALPVMAAWARSVRVVAFRPSMGVSGLAPREVARLRTLGLASGARMTGLFEGATDFRMGFPPSRGENEMLVGVEADLSGHPLSAAVSDLMLACFGLPAGRAVAHTLRGLTHTRGGASPGDRGHVLAALGRELDLDLKVRIEELGFEPQGLGRVAITASRGAVSRGPVDWTDRGSLRAVRVIVGGVRPRLDQLDKLEAALRDTWWEARRIEPRVERLITPGIDQGAFLQQDVEFERGGAAFVEVMSRSTAPLALARRAVKKAQAYMDSAASCDEATGLLALTAAVGASARFDLALAPSRRVLAVCALLRDLGAAIEEKEAPGLVLVRATG